MVTNAKQAQVLSRRAKVAELLVRGISNQFEICRRLGMEEKQRVTISHDIMAIKKAWKELAIVKFDEAVSIELAKLEKLEAEYWAAWERSVAERQSSRTARRRRSNPAVGEKPASENADEFAEVRKEQRDGNPAFLAGVMSCIQKRCELLGINAPKHFIHSGDENNPIALTVKPPVPLESLTISELKALRDIRARLVAPVAGLASAEPSRN